MPQQIPALPGLAEIARLLRPTASHLEHILGKSTREEVTPPPSPVSIFRR
jgi:hypothetical protein